MTVAGLLAGAVLTTAEPAFAGICGDEDPTCLDQSECAHLGASFFCVPDTDRGPNYKCCIDPTRDAGTAPTPDSGGAVDPVDAGTEVDSGTMSSTTSTRTRTGDSSGGGGRSSRGGCSCASSAGATGAGAGLAFVLLAATRLLRRRRR